MRVRTGCDIVEINRFAMVDKATLGKIFHPSEYTNRRPETVAGLFAAKESCKKVFNELSWHDIEVQTKETGKPTLLINTRANIVDCDVSISHDGDYAIAQVVFLLNDE